MRRAAERSGGGGRSYRRGPWRRPRLDRRPLGSGSEAELDRQATDTQRRRRDGDHGEARHDALLAGQACEAVMVMSGSLRVFQPLAGADIQGRWPPRLVMGKGGGGNETLQQQHEREQDRPHPPRRRLCP